jgi:hypothetical protein
MKMHWFQLLGIFLLIIGLLTSCMTPAWARQRVAEVRRGIPDPSQAEILVEEISNASGSQDDCIGAEYTIRHVQLDFFGVYLQVNSPGGIALCLTKSCSLLLSIV